MTATPKHEALLHRAAAPWWRRRGGIAFPGFVLIGIFYLLREHYWHTLGALPYLILLACPLMHLLMHHGHGAPEKATKHASANRVI